MQTSEAATPKQRWMRNLGVTLVALLLCALVWWVATLLSTKGEPKKKQAVQEIALLKPPPPTPPPKVEPPKVEPPKQVIQEKQEVPKPDQQPDKAADKPPPGPDLGIDAAGTGAGDGFGLVGKKGGADLIGSGGGGPTIGTPNVNRFAWYGDLMKSRVQEAIQKDKKLREVAAFRVTVNVWVGPDGAFTRSELVGAPDDSEVEAALKAVLSNMAPLREGAPGDMPQPVKLRISSR